MSYMYVVHFRDCESIRDRSLFKYHIIKAIISSALAQKSTDKNLEKVVILNTLVNVYVDLLVFTRIAGTS